MTAATTAAPRARLSAVLITRNAATIIDACFESLAFADEIVIVDSASSDGTLEIARRRGARVVQKEWLGYGRQKQFAVEQAKFDNAFNKAMGAAATGLQAQPTSVQALENQLRNAPEIRGLLEAQNPSRPAS